MAMTPVADEAWAKCLAALRGKLFSQSYDTWLRPLACKQFDAANVVLEAPHSFSASWIEENYLKDIREVVRELFRIAPDIRLVVGEGSRPAATSSGAASYGEQTTLWQLPQKTPTAPLKPLSPVTSIPSVQGSDGFGLPVILNPEYTFESFVVSACNEVASSAAQTVAARPGKTPFNPLFVYGGVGIGKTHLLQAVARHCLENGTARSPLYVTSEQFARDFVTALKDHQTLQFAKFYRQAEVLLLDDIQFFGGKERMQEEFFHTFNTLHNMGKQIIISSDRAPEELGGLQDRLLSRMQWGLVADIQQPDLETRIAICQKKAEARGLALNDDIAEYIAHQVRTSIRELEGVIKRLVFLSDNLRTVLTLDVAEQAVRTMRTAGAEQRTAQVTVESVLESVAAYYRIPVAALVGKSKRADIIAKRQLAIYLCKTLTLESLRAIGAAFGGRDHTTVLHACERFAGRLAADSSARAARDAISSSLGRTSGTPARTP